MATKFTHPSVLDAALNVIKNGTAVLTICSQQPTTHAEATSTYALADVDMTSASFTGPLRGDGALESRKLVIAKQVGVRIDRTGTGTYVALCSSGTLLYTGPCYQTFALVAGETFNIPSFRIEFSPPGYDPDEQVLPLQYDVPAYSLPIGGTTRYVNAGGDLQAALTAAQPGDVIVLEAGATFLTPQGTPFVIRNKSGAGWIYIISSAMASLPSPGTRVSPVHSSSMANIQSNAGYNAAITVDTTSSKIRFCGIEFSCSAIPVGRVVYGLVQIGINELGVPSMTNHADNIVVDRCYVHGNLYFYTRDGITVYNATNLAIQDSHISDFAGEIVNGSGLESHAIHLYCPPGPVKVHNNYISSGGINFFVSDSSPVRHTDGSLMTPTDVTCTQNFIHKPDTWDYRSPNWAGRYVSVKNLWETKGVNRCLIEGNRLENCWTNNGGGQLGVAVVIKTNGGDVRNLTFRNNVIVNCETSTTISNQGGDTERPNLIMQNLLIENNLFMRMNYYSAATNSAHTVASAGSEKYSLFRMHWRHNTEVWNGISNAWLVCQLTVGGQLKRGDYSNNIGQFGYYGVFMNGGRVGTAAWQYICPDGTMINNVLAGPYWPYASGNYNTVPGVFGPIILPETWADVGFVNYQGNSIDNYALTAQSPYKNGGTDGQDIGCNIAQLKAALAASDVF